MRITLYNTELNNDLHCTLVKEKTWNYSGCQVCNTPETIATVFNDIFRLNRQSEEHLYMICFNVRMKPLGIFKISQGTVNSSLCSPREIFLKSLLSNATAITIIHNHPSQDVTPSQEDIIVYEKLKDAGNFIGIHFLDSIIVGNGYYSFYENYENRKEK